MLSRRDWFQFIAAVVVCGANARAGAQLPAQFGVAAPPPCDPTTVPTPARKAVGFRPGAPMRTKIADASEPGQPLVVLGTVSGIRCGLIAGAELDAWQANAAGKMAATGFRLRGRQKTDAQGRYRIDTVLPGAVGKEAPRVNLRVRVPARLTLTTAVLLPLPVIAGKDVVFHVVLDL